MALAAHVRAPGSLPAAAGIGCREHVMQATKGAPRHLSHIPVQTIFRLDPIPG